VARRDPQAIAARCTRFVPSWPARRDPAGTFRALAARAGPSGDVYGGGESVKRLEARVAERLGKEAAAVFPSGTMAAGPEDVIAEARVWRVRHGGRLASFEAIALSGERGLDEVLPRMPAFVRKAKAIGRALVQVGGGAVIPDPPQVAMLHVFVRGELERLCDVLRRVDARDPDGRDRRALRGARHASVAPSQRARLFKTGWSDTGFTPSSHQTPLTRSSRVLRSKTGSMRPTMRSPLRIGST